MGIKSNAEKVLNNIERLAEAYEKAKGHKMPSVSITEEQFEAVNEAIAKEKIGSINWNGKTYKGIALNIR